MKLFKKILTKEVKIAFVTVVALALLVFGINYLKGINIFEPSIYYNVKFHDVNGLVKSSPVYADGFKIGIVNDIIYDYNHPGNIDVKIELDTSMKMPHGTTARISSNLMGGLRLDLLFPKNIIAYCAVGDTISGCLDTGLMSTVSQLVPAVEKMLPKIDSILNSLNKITSDPSIVASLHSLQQTTSNLADASGDLKKLMKHDVPVLLYKVNKIGDNAIEVTEKLKRVDLQATLSKVDSTIMNVKMATAKFNSKDNSMGLLLNDRSVYDNLNVTVNSANDLLKDIKTNPKRYVHFSVFGKKDKK